MAWYNNHDGTSVATFGLIVESQRSNGERFDTNGFCCGFWFYPLSYDVTVNARVQIFTAVDAAFTQSRTLFYDVNSTQIVMAQNNGTEVAAGIGGGGATPPLNQWSYVIARFIANNNRRGHVLTPANFYTIQDTVSNALTANINSAVFGTLSTPPPGDYAIAEFWYAYTDLMPGNVDMTAAQVRNLAMHGPWSMPGLLFPHRYASLRDQSYLGRGIWNKFGLLGSSDNAGNAEGWFEDWFAGSRFPHPPLGIPYDLPMTRQRPLVG